MHRIARHCAIMLVLLIAAVAPAAAGSELDVFLRVLAGRIVTGQVDASTGTPIVDELRVFPATFGEASQPTFTNDPGFFALAGTFPVGSQVGFNVLAPLRAWTGSGFSATSQTLTIVFSTLSVTTGEGAVPGFSLFVMPSGGYHRHLSFFLHGPGSRPPAPGIYLLELEKTSSSPAISSSLPFWIVFNFQQPTGVHDAALDWALAHLPAPPCPADLDGSGGVNGLDLAVLLGQWSGAARYAPCPPLSPADLNQDCRVNGLDLAVLLGSWGPCP